MKSDSIKLQEQRKSHWKACIPSPKTTKKVLQTDFSISKLSPSLTTLLMLQFEYNVLKRPNVLTQPAQLHSNIPLARRLRK